jgi:hypothetical protein
MLKAGKATRIGLTRRLVAKSRTKGAPRHLHSAGSRCAGSSPAISSLGWPLLLTNSLLLALVAETWIKDFSFASNDLRMAASAARLSHQFAR